ncbi:hypothetical protein [Micromonospora maris]|uniref:Uncharacterized protein n=1 Tax=Micromonospora maris TaxID=1003110 RepID=A0A9X0I613_9ACTN|nr:hypothetical protein [Micromonospora maris]AEB42172.1 hypothetical protein VAB18032_05230 [Micromonospora maris AB-18-032]KUJ47690.1 hypothetical protein ADL17_00730 [Micromonospora maris]
MLSSPVWRGLPALYFCLGLVAGGVVIAAALLLVGSLLRAPLPPPVRIGIVLVAALVVTLRELGVLRFPLPENKRLVPESVFRLGRFAGPFQFGLEMGTGVRTYLPSGLAYLTAVVLLLFATPLTAVAAGVGFGLGRSLMTTSALHFDDSGGWNLEWDHRSTAVTRVLLVGYLAALAVLVSSLLPA